MNFNSYIFIFVIFPITILGYYICGKKSNKLALYFLFVISLFVYGLEERKYVYVIALSILINYLIYIIYSKIKNKIIIYFGIMINVLSLIYFKYFYMLFGIKSFALPIAISFYTFSNISFLCDSLKEDNNYSLVEYATYVLYFPKIVQGPIVGIKDFVSQLQNKISANYEKLLSGLLLFMYGLSKKVILADKYSSAVSWGFGNIDKLDSGNALITMFSFTLQIYLDFSGYTDMVIGISRMLNIDLPNNFNNPYRSTDIKEFWKSWHISLTKFFTKYIYIPLGGNRKGLIRECANTLLIFVISGFWHGANWNYVLWGFLNGLLLAVYKLTHKYIDKVPKYIKWPINIIIINLLWIVFRCNSINDIKVFFEQLLSLKFSGINANIMNSFNFTELDFVPESFYFIRIFQNSRYYVFIYLIFGFIISLFDNEIKDKITNSKKINLFIIIIILLFIYSVLSLTSNGTFIYEGF